MRRDVPAGPPPTLTVAAVARRLGIAPATLRTWDRRYGLGPSEHTAGSHRRYSPQDVARLLVMRRLTLEGVAPAEAASLALSSPADHLPATHDPFVPASTPGAQGAPPQPAGHSAPPGTHLAAVSDPPQPSAGTPTSAGVHATGASGAAGSVSATPAPRPAAGPPAAQPAGAPAPGGVGAAAADGLSRLTAFEPGRAGGGRVVALPGGTPLSRGLARAAMALDSHECSRIIHEHLQRHGTAATWEQLVAPVLVAIGERWEATGEAIEVEHLLTECVMGGMRAVTAGLRHARNPRPVLLAAAEDELHGLPLHVLGAALAERGVASRMLGVRVPRTALAAAVHRTGPAAVVVHAQLRIADPGQLDALPRLRPAPLLLLGGPGWDGVPAPPGAERVGQLDQAVGRVMRAVGL